MNQQILRLRNGLNRRLKPRKRDFFKMRNFITSRIFSNTIEAYWYPEKNFGDQLTPDILRYYGYRPLRAPDFDSCNIAAVGSILEIIPESYQGVIVGSGFIHSSTITQFPRADIRLVRGRLTASKLGLKEGVAVGDPGIIADEIYGNRLQRINDTREKVGFVPHYKHVEHPEVKHFIHHNASKMKVIDVRRKPSVVVSEIASCNTIVSSSLHGLIIAHSFGIPTVTVEVNDLPLRGGRYKFKDYFSVFDLEPVFSTLQGDSSLDELLGCKMTIEPCKLNEVKEGVRQAFKGLI